MASGGRPVGVKLAAGHIERDLAFCTYADPDFITIDGRGGATGSSPRFLRDSASVPTIYALHRARKYLDSIGSSASLIITGGLRVSSDFAKAIAMGADAVAGGFCPADGSGLPAIPDLRHRDVPYGNRHPKPRSQSPAKDRAGRRKSCQFPERLSAGTENLCADHGHSRLSDLSVDDLCTDSREISEHTDILHA